MSIELRQQVLLGIYKLVKRHTRLVDTGALGRQSNGVSPHVFRHSLAVGLLQEVSDGTAVPELADGRLSENF